MIKDAIGRLKASHWLPARLLCGFFWSLKSSMRRRRFAWVYRRGDGRYVNRDSRATFVSPNTHAASIEQVRNRVVDQWLYKGGVSRGTVIVDLGAGVGDDAVAFAEYVGPEGRVIAIEAHPETFACMQETIELNGLANVMPVCVAVADQVGRVAMQSGTTYVSGKLVQAGGDITVEVTTLPLLLDQLGVDTVDFLKMNIEGAELATLKGCIGRFHRIKRMVVSCHDFIADRDPADHAMRTHDAIVGLLNESGYKVTSGREDVRPWVRYYVYADARD